MSVITNQLCEHRLQKAYTNTDFRKYIRAQGIDVGVQGWWEKNLTWLGSYLIHTHAYPKY